MNWGAVGAVTGVLGMAFAAGVWVTTSEKSDETLRADLSELMKEVEEY